MSKFKFPTAQTTLIFIAVFVAILTWVVPSGKYDSLSYDSSSSIFIISGTHKTHSISATQTSLDSLGISIPLKNFTSGDIYKPISIPNTYMEVEANPQGFFDLAMSPIKGIMDTADIIFLVLFIGGLIGVVNYTKAFDAGIAWLADALKGKEFLLIIITTALMALGGSTFGLGEETLAFIPILLPVFIAANYDEMVAVATIFIGSSVGIMCSTTNPFATIIASDTAGVNWTSGLNGRWLMFVICTTVCILYILRYARRIKKKSTKSVTYHLRADESILPPDANNTIALTHRMRGILFIFILSFVVMVFGVIKLEWWLGEMTTVFLVAAILIAIVGKIPEDKLVELFSKGAGELLGVAFIIGIARGVSILMNEGLISDTILYNASHLTNGMAKGVFITTVFAFYNAMTFFISSTSGMAVLTMPIMAPLGDSAGVAREIVVNAYQYGVGLFNMMSPTGLVLASIALVRINYGRWLKFILPLFCILFVITVVVLVISVY